MDTIELWQVGVGAALFLVGLGAGLALRRGDASAKKRVAELEGELAEAKRQHEAQQASVEKHFEKTSDIFRDLTENYTALYGHLAEGARNLCPDASPALARGLASPLLQEGLETDGDLADLEPLDDLEDLADLQPRTESRSESALEDLTPLDEVADLAAPPAPGTLDDMDEEPNLPATAEESTDTKEKKAS